VVTSQGHLFKAKVLQAPEKRRGGGLRGKVRGFSRASRKRLLELVARLDYEQIQGHRHIATFITLTYPGEQGTLPSPQECKRHLWAFWKRIERRWPWVSGVWREQFDSGGERDYHPHFHLILFNLPWIDKAEILRWWCEITGRDSENATRIEAIRTWRGVLSYAARYCAEPSGDDGGLVHLAYLAEHFGSDCTGRVWGVFNRDNLPFAEVVELAIIRGRWFFDLKRGARKVWERVNDHAWAGFSLFVENPERWVELALHYADGEGAP
jgi:hypothetical protein